MEVQFLKKSFIFIAVVVFLSMCFTAMASAAGNFERKSNVNDNWGVGVRHHEHKEHSDNNSSGGLLKKGLYLSLGVLLVICCASFASAGWKFENKIRIICPWSAGGASDETVRNMAKLLNVILNQEVEVINVPGREGCNAIEYVYKLEPDGYNFLLGTQSLFMQDIQANTDVRFYEEFTPVARVVHAINVLTVSEKAARENNFKTFSDLLTYVEKNPFEISVGMLTSTGLDGVALKQTVENLDILKVAYHSDTDLSAALVEGHIDLMIGGISEIRDLIEDGEVIPLLTLSHKRLRRFPEVQCAAEMGIDSYMGPARGIFARKDTPQEAVDALSEAIKKASRDPAWMKFLADNTYDERVCFADFRTYRKACEEDYKMLSEFLKNEGLLKRSYMGIVKSA